MLLINSIHQIYYYTNIFNGSIEPEKMKVESFSKLKSVVGVNSVSSANRELIKIENYTFKANVSYLIIASSRMVQVNGGSAIWAFETRLDGVVKDFGRVAAPAGAVSPQTNVTIISDVEFDVDTTVKSTLMYVTRLQGDNSINVEVPKLKIVPIAFA